MNNRCELCDGEPVVIRTVRGYDICPECLGNIVEDEMQRRAEAEHSPAGGQSGDDHLAYIQSQAQRVK